MSKRSGESGILMKAEIPDEDYIPVVVADEIMDFQTLLTTPTGRDLSARLIEPDAWEEYDQGKGVCSNQAGWKIQDSIIAANRICRYAKSKKIPVVGMG